METGGGADGVITQVVTLLLGLGLPGVIIIAQSFIIYKLYNRTQELNDTLFDVGKEAVKAQESTTSALNRLSDLLLRGKAEA